MRIYAELDSLGREDIEGRIVRYLSTWPQGLTSARMSGWINSCSKAGGYSVTEYEKALYRLRDSGRIAIANKIWYLRKAIPQ